MKTKTTKITGILLTLVMLVSMLGVFAITASAAEGIAYIDANGDEQTQASATEVTSSTTTWNSGWYVVNSDIVVSERITAEGDVHLILCDDASLIVDGSVYVTANSSLYIYGQSNGTGSLTTTAQNNYAGIGGSQDTDNINIVINGGTITATGGGSGAGIGGGPSGDNINVSINGGNITATAGLGAAGIGGGQTGKNITVSITGGYINATGGGQTGAGIGTGNAVSDSSLNVSISGGTIIATGTTDIGWGQNGYGTANVTITGGNIQTTSGAIQNATNGSNAVSVQEITIPDGYDISDLSIKDENNSDYDYKLTDVQPIDGKVYLYLPEGVTASTECPHEWVNGTCIICSETAPSATLDISNGSITLTADASGTLFYQQGTGDAVAYSGTVTITGTSTGENANTIAVESGTHNVILSNVTISWDGDRYAYGMSDPFVGYIPFSIASGSNVVLTLEGTNTLFNPEEEARVLNIAAVAVPAGASLRINGTGTLIATGCGSGIGTNEDQAAGVIIIDSGTVIATGKGGFSPGIGGQTFESITINGGHVEAYAADDESAAAIGCSNSTCSGKIEINGGFVKASAADSGAGIGTGSGSRQGNSVNYVTVVINGGTVYATSFVNANGYGGAGIGGGMWMGGATVQINGGNVLALGAGGAMDIGHGEPNEANTLSPGTLKNAAGEDVYLVCIDGLTEPTSIVIYNADGTEYSYATTDVELIEGALYLYVPKTVNKIVVNGIVYNICWYTDIVAKDLDGDGIYEDASGNLYVPDQDGDGNAELVTDTDGNGIYEDASGNLYIPDQNSDGIAEKVTDTDADGVYEGENGLYYLPDGNGNLTELTDIDGDGIYEDASGKKYITAAVVEKLIEELEEAISKLETAEGNVGFLMTQIGDVYTKLNGLGNTYATNDAVQQAINEANEILIDEYTKMLGEAYDLLDDKIFEKADSATLTAEINKLIVMIEDAQKSAISQDEALKDEMQEVLKELNKRLAALEEALEDIAELESSINTIEQQITNINGSIDDLKGVDAELKGYVDALQNTAADLQSKIDATNTALAALESDLEGQITASEQHLLNELNAVRTALEGQLATVNNTIAMLQAKDAELDQKIADLMAYVDGATNDTKDWATTTFSTLEQYEAIQTTISEINALIKSTQESITALENKLTKKINDDIAAAVADVDADIAAKVIEITNAYTAAVDDATEAITAAYTDAIKSAILASETSMKEWVNAVLAEGYYTKAELDGKITALQTQVAEDNAALQREIDALEAALEKADTDNKAELVKKIEDAQTTLQAAIDKIASDLAQAKTDLQNAIDGGDKTLDDKISALNTALDNAKAALEATDAANKADLEEQIANAKSSLRSSINTVQNNLDEAVAALEQAIANGDNDLSGRISALNTALDNAISAYQAADGSLKSELTTKIEAADATLDAAIKAVQKNLDDAKAELNKAIADGDTELDGKIATLNDALASAKAALEAADTANKSELTTKIDEADAALGAAIDALSSELNSVKQALEKADADNKAALEAKDSELQTFIIIVCVISGVALCGSGAFVVWFFIDRKKRI